MKRIYRAASLVQVAHVRHLSCAPASAPSCATSTWPARSASCRCSRPRPQLYVDDVDEARALRVLASAAAPATGEPWNCGACGERLEPQFTHCWRCGAEHGPQGS